MKHPTVFLLPALMLADYFLTLYASSLREKGYARFFVAEHYELNPIWQRDIAVKRRSNLSFFAFVAFYSSALFYFTEHSGASRSVVYFAFGLLFTIYAIILGRHISNIFIYSNVAKHENELRGTVSMNQSFLLKHAIFNFFPVTLPIFLICIFVPSPFVYGSALGCVTLLATHGVWLIKFLSRKKPPS